MTGNLIQIWPQILLSGGGVSPIAGLFPYNINEKGIIENEQTNEHVNHQKVSVFECFKPNGLQIRNQHIFLHRIACVKNGFDIFVLSFCHFDIR